VRANGSQLKNRQAFCQVIFVDVAVVGACRLEFGEDLLGRVGPETVGVRVVALPGDDVDTDLVAQPQ